MIDLHNHILPGLDDGSDSIGKSLNMARIAVDDGIKVIVATPHSRNGVYNTEPDKILREVKRFDDLLQKEGIPLLVLPGADVYLDPALIEDIKNHKVMTVNDNKQYIMLEIPPFGLPQHLSEFIWELRLSGATPILSHPERNETIQENINILYECIRQGALAQLTAMSLTGEFGKKAHKCAALLLKHNLAHVIASDAHSVRKRPPVLSRALKVAGKIVGHDQALKMVAGIPDKIIKGEQISFPAPEKRKSRFF